MGEYTAYNTGIIRTEWSGGAIRVKLEFSWQTDSDNDNANNWKLGESMN